MAYKADVSQEDVNIMLREVGNGFAARFPEVCDSVPEADYYAFSFATILLPMILQSTSSVVFSQARLDQAGAGWNFLDAALALGSGIVLSVQAADEKTHRRLETGVKGATNIASAVALTTVTAVGIALGATLMGPAGFAAASGAAFALSLIDTQHAIRRWASFDYWLEDSLKLFAKQNLQIQALQDEITALKAQAKGKSLSKSSQWALDKKEENLRETVKAHSELEKDIIARTALRQTNETVNLSPNQRKAFEEREIVVINKAKSEAKEASANSMMLALNFPAMVLFALALVPGPHSPALLAASIVLIAITSAMYALKHSKKVGDKLEAHQENKQEKIFVKLEKQLEEKSKEVSRLKKEDPTSPRLVDIQKELATFKQDISGVKLSAEQRDKLNKDIHRINVKINAITPDVEGAPAPRTPRP